VPALLALLVVVPLLAVPGALLVRALDPRPAPGAFEAAYTAVVAGALLNGWLAFTLGQLGIFSIWLHLVIVCACCLLAAAIIKRRNPGAFSLQPSAFSRPKGTRPSAFSLQRFALLLALALFALLVARPFEVIVGVRDAGVYANAGLAMAHTGGLVQHDPLVAQIAEDQHSPDRELAAAAAQAETNFLGTQNRDRFIATRLRAAGFFIYEGDLDAGRVTPQGLHLFTAWVALLAGLLGPYGGLLAPGLMGLLGLWSVAMLARHLAGPWAAVLAALLLGLNAAQVWFSRYSTTETTAQFLTFAGLYFFAVLTRDEGRGTRGERRGDETARFEVPPPCVDLPSAFSLQPSVAQRAPGLQPSAFSLQSPKGHPAFSVPALLAGLAFGQLALARIEFFLVLAPLVLYLLYTWLTRRWSRSFTLLAAALGVTLLHAAVQFTTLARAYFFDTLYARLQDYAVTALISLPFLTPALRQTFLRRPCSPLTLQPCPPIDGMPPTVDAPLNIARIAGELAFVALLLVALVALRRWGQPLFAALEAKLRRFAGPLSALAAAVTLLLGAYAYLVRPQILTPTTIAALPSCLAPAQLRAPQGACLALQGYVGAPIVVPGYVDPVAAAFGAFPQRLRGQNPPSPAACAASRQTLLPPAAKGLTVPELIEDRLLDTAALPAETLAELRACDRLVLRSQFANSQANLVRVGWYTSPLGIALGFAGLALLWRRLTPGSFMVLAVSLLAGFVFIRVTYGTSDQHYIYILRRYIPQVYPALALACAVALATLLPNAKCNMQKGAPSGRALAFCMLHFAFAAVLVAFLAFTGLPIFRHTEYGGAVTQVAGIAARFEPGDVLLMRGGAPTFAEARDLPDVLATPLRFIHGVDAFTVKSREPGRYAADLARYVREWQARGKRVFLAAGASGALQLPGLALEPAGTIEVSLDEFEQLTNQKPRNVQNFALSFALYRVVPADQAAAPPVALAPTDYAAQLGGFYRAEQPDGETIAWTNGDALLRLETAPGAQPETITLHLGGGARPEALGPQRACVSLAALDGAWHSALPLAYTPPECVTLAARPGPHTVAIPPALLAGREALLVRIESPTWVPARDDPQGRDPRRLGVQFAGLATQ
jgi:hypothetical protein